MVIYRYVVWNVFLFTSNEHDFFYPPPKNPDFADFNTWVGFSQLIIESIFKVRAFGGIKKSENCICLVIYLFNYLIDFKLQRK